MLNERITIFLIFLFIYFWLCWIFIAAAAAAKLLQLCLTLCDPIDGSPPDYPVPGILQARTLGWVGFSLQWLLLLHRF